MLYANYDEFEIIREAGKRLKEILARDFPDSSPDEWPIDEGSEDYIIRAVIEALGTFSPTPPEAN